jgi:hypothetical protein
MKGKILSSPMYPHIITHLRDISDTDNESDENSATDNKVWEREQVESNEEEVDETVVANNQLPIISGSNILIPELDISIFITYNFSCKLCEAPVQVPNLKSVKVGCACNLFWKCSNPKCDAKEVSGITKRYHPNVVGGLGNYDINQQIVLACQQSPSGGRMASTFGGLLSLTNCLIWNNNFTGLEQMIGKAQICRGKKIINQNLQNKILVSPMDLTLNRAKVMLMMDGGWDQRASGKAYNSVPGRLVSVRPRTNKVCGLVYYLKR